MVGFAEPHQRLRHGTRRSVPYSFPHLPRRAFAHAYEDPDQPLTPLAESEDPLVDEAEYPRCGLVGSTLRLMEELANNTAITFT